MRDIIISLFGSYTPITGQTGIASIDFEWLTGTFLFALTLYCIFRLIGGIFK